MLGRDGAAEMLPSGGSAVVDEACASAPADSAPGAQTEEQRSGAEASAVAFEPAPEQLSASPLAEADGALEIIRSVATAPELAADDCDPGRKGHPPSMQPSMRASSCDDVVASLHEMPLAPIIAEEGEEAEVRRDARASAPAAAVAPAAAESEVGPSAEVEPAAPPARDASADATDGELHAAAASEREQPADDKTGDGAGDECPPLVATSLFRGSFRHRIDRRNLGALGDDAANDRPSNGLPPTFGRARSESVTDGSEVKAMVLQLPQQQPPAAGPQAPAGCSPAFWTDACRAQDVADAVQKFNLKPREGIRYLRAKGLLDPERTPSAEGVERAVLESDARTIAAFLHNAKGLSKRNIGDFVGDSSDLSKLVLLHYTRTYDFGGMAFIDALRAYLTPFRLPGESQKIDRIMECFSGHYHATNPNIFSCSDTAYTLAFSLIMLNTDLHSREVTRKMTEADFIKNNRGIDQGADIAEHILLSAYRDIKRTEIKTTTAFDELSQHELVQWLAQGSVFVKFTHGRVGALKSSHHQVKMWIRDDQLRYRNISKRMRGEKQIPLSAVTDVIVGPKSQVFRRHGVRARVTRQSSAHSASSADTGSGGGANDPDRAYFSLVLNQRTIDLQADTAELGDFWSRYFKQVVERSRIEATARRLALRAQPRERFVEQATRIWSTEILPEWETQRAEKRTQMLWWEGLPSSVRGNVWLHVLGEDTASIANLSSARSARPLIPPKGDGSAAHAAALAGAGEWLDEQLPHGHVELYSFYGCAPRGARASASPRRPLWHVSRRHAHTRTHRPRIDRASPARSRTASPFRESALQALSTLSLQYAAAHGGQSIRARAPTAPLVAAMLLIQLEPPLAYAALATLVVMHVPGATDADAMQWRNLGTARASAGHRGRRSAHAAPTHRSARARVFRPPGPHARPARRRAARAGFQLVLEQELPVLHALFESLRIEPLDYFLPWLQALFVPVLTIDTAARLWDCYMRDGEVFLWRAAIELLRKRTNELLTEGTAGREHVLLLLRQPIDPMLIADKARGSQQRCPPQPRTAQGRRERSAAVADARCARLTLRHAHRRSSRACRRRRTRSSNGCRFFSRSCRCLSIAGICTQTATTRRALTSM